MKTYFFDLDGTLCTIAKDYRKAMPFKNRVKEVNQLYREGNYIVIHTARGTLTKIDWKEITEKQLKKWGLKYHGLYIGIKPVYDFWIDDKAINSEEYFQLCD